MNVSDFDYELPPELIAQYPAPERAASRLLVMSRATGKCEIRSFAQFPELLNPGDCLVLNDTRVVPARLLGRRAPTGGSVEALVLEQIESRRWLCMLKPGRRLRPGDRVELEAESAVGFTVSARRADGRFEVAFDTDEVPALLDRAGLVPLPPYIRRCAEADDRHRYQTVYADKPGAVAAPTAGLHFSSEILADIRGRGVAVAAITLHVGPGTFRPVTADRVEEHLMHEEAYELSPQAAELVNSTRARAGRVLAVGTTSVRVLETCADPATRTVTPGCGRTRLFLHPPYDPAIPDALLTNFHLPRSTLLMLVSAFSSVEHVLAAYRLAIRERMRFYSYGDCMLLL